ncbi:hypothetical protein [Sphingomonas bacterium]|uniref:hypothetical protein n=1 Tax=Sphingomonas bacterium TaxID=1895847 RepID=UPI001575781A|nr:hypothetical protein [Sphingomonas bacterium]
MKATISLASALAVVMLGGCGGGRAGNESSDKPIIVEDVNGQDNPYRTDATMNAAEFIRRNNLAIAEGKRLDAVLARYAAADHPKFERLQLACVTKARGMRIENAAAISRCVERAW